MKEYLLRLTAAALLAALFRRMAPRGGPGRAARLGAGLLVLLTAFSPLERADPLRAAQELTRSGFSDPLSIGRLELENNRLLSGLISDQAEAYILDKARDLGLTVTVQVETRVTERYPVPWSAELQGRWSGEDRAALEAVIASDLGIPAERQEWMEME